MSYIHERYLSATYLVIVEATSEVPVRGNK